MIRILSSRETAMEDILSRGENRVPETVERDVRAILDEVKAGGDSAVLAFNKKFGGAEQNSLLVTAEEMEEGWAKADKELIRTGETRAKVEAVFSDVGEAIADKLTQLGFECEDGEISLARTNTVDGKSVARVNGRSVTLSVLREISSALFNIHGQNDNVQLLNAQNHIRILDSFADNSALCR